MDSGAKLSDDGMYRWHLWRQWGEGLAVCFVMLNPSTANATDDDPTIRRCIGFAKSWGYTRLDVVNLFAYRATDPRELLTAAAPTGSENNQHIRDVAGSCDAIVCAWGKLDKQLRHRQSAIMRVLKGRRLHCLEHNKDRSPKHPLYVRAETTLREWQP
jgi:hypothetical protein